MQLLLDPGLCPLPPLLSEVYTGNDHRCRGTLREQPPTDALPCHLCSVCMPGYLTVFAAIPQKAILTRSKDVLSLCSKAMILFWF